MSNSYESAKALAEYLRKALPAQNEFVVVSYSSEKTCVRAVLNTAMGFELMSMEFFGDCEPTIAKNVCEAAAKVIANSVIPVKREAATVEMYDVGMYRAGYKIKGDPAAVGVEIENLIRRYPPMGYGTRLASDNTVDGKRVAVVIRANSCD